MSVKTYTVECYQPGSQFRYCAPRGFRTKRRAMQHAAQLARETRAGGYDTIVLDDGVHPQDAVVAKWRDGKRVTV